MHQTCCVLKISVENRKIYSYLRNISSNDIKHKYLLFCQITIFLSKVRVDFEKILQWLFKMLKMHFRTQCLQCAFVTSYIHGYEKYTVWNFHDFSTTQILREINFSDSRSAKSAVLPLRL